MVEIRPLTGAWTGDKFMIVGTFGRPQEKGGRFAMIHSWEKIGEERPVIKKLVDTQPMSHDQALEWAKKYADENSFPVIYESAFD